MNVWPDDVLEYEHNYKMEIHFPELGWLQGQWVKVKILWNLDAMSIGSNWITGGADTWYLFYHLKASGVVVTHREVFNEAIKTVYDGAMWIDAVDLGEEEPLFTPDVSLPEFIKKIPGSLGKYWGSLLAIIIIILVLLVILPYGYKRGK